MGFVLAERPPSRLVWMSFVLAERPPSRLVWMGFVLAERLLLHTLFVLNVIEGWT